MQLENVKGSKLRGSHARCGHVQYRSDREEPCRAQLRETKQQVLLKKDARSSAHVSSFCFIVRYMVCLIGIVIVRCHAASLRHPKHFSPHWRVEFLFPTLACGVFVFSAWRVGFLFLVLHRSFLPPPALPPIHSHSHTHSLIHTPSNTLTLTHSLTHTHSHTLTHTHSLTHAHSHTLTQTHSLTHTHSHALTHTL